MVPWNVVYRSSRDNNTSELQLDSATEPNLAAVQAKDKNAVYLVSVEKASRNLYRVQYHERGKPSELRVNVLAYNQREAVAHVGEVDNVSVVNIAAGVAIAGVDEPLKNIYPGPVIPLADASQEAPVGPVVMPQYPDNRLRAGDKAKPVTYTTTKA